ncbi:GGDEF domain-containing protein [Massilia arenosa]|uniref:diguanylate cyclase n=1 Tax=Zemynaea arenosa TaxID=2561931 RepID=A0A4Y9SH57_9BURK|nr:GGDEF domain-containing protein [Massilia arenosa]TFW20989.1 GGDEF domain-containing protein [Massilia arenosa]
MTPLTPMQKRVRQLRYWAGTVLVYGACFAMLQREVLIGRLPAQRVTAVGFVAAVALLLFVLLIWFSERLRIPNWRLAQAQAAFAVGFDVMLYAFAPPEHRASMLIGLPVVIVFSAFALRPRQTLALSGFGLMLLLLACLILGYVDMDPRRMGDELTNFGLAAIGIISVAVVTSDHARLRVKLVAQQAELQAALAKIERAANTDELTALLNRHGVRSRFHAETDEGELTLALIDIDHFKKLNDALGHDAGDTALRHFAEVARRSVRARDAVARWGGEEFLIVMPDTGLADACRMLERLQLGLRDLPHLEAGLTISAGVVRQRDGESFDAMVGRADALMYEAKQSGRDAIRVETAV